MMKDRSIVTWKNFTQFPTGGNGNPGEFEDVLQAFGSIPPEAGELLEPGHYEVDVLRGGLARKGRKFTPCFECKLRVRDGKFAGRVLWRDFWLSEAALPRAARELAALNIRTADDLKRGTPAGLVALATVGLEADDTTGEQRNTVVKLASLRVESPAQDPFAPAAEPPADEGKGAVDVPF